MFKIFFKLYFLCLVYDFLDNIEINELYELMRGFKF